MRLAGEVGRDLQRLHDSNHRVANQGIVDNPVARVPQRARATTGGVLAAGRGGGILRTVGAYLREGCLGAKANSVPWANMLAEDEKTF